MNLSLTHTVLFTFLVSFGIMHILSQLGFTALMWAAINGHMSIVRLLLDHGASVHVLNKVSSSLNRAIQFVSCMKVLQSHTHRHASIPILNLMYFLCLLPKYEFWYSQHGKTAYRCCRDPEIRQLLRVAAMQVIFSILWFHCIFLFVATISKPICYISSYLNAYLTMYRKYDYILIPLHTVRFLQFPFLRRG